MKQLKITKYFNRHEVHILPVIDVMWTDVWIFIECGWLLFELEIRFKYNNESRKYPDLDKDL